MVAVLAGDDRSWRCRRRACACGDAGKQWRNLLWCPDAKDKGRRLVLMLVRINGGSVGRRTHRGWIRRTRHGIERSTKENEPGAHLEDPGGVLRPGEVVVAGIRRRRSADRGEEEEELVGLRYFPLNSLHGGEEEVEAQLWGSFTDPRWRRSG